MKPKFKLGSLHWLSIGGGLLLGIIVGILIATPLAVWQKPESIATLIGSAFGAFMPVIGAIILWQWQAKLASRGSVLQIAMNLLEMEYSIDRCLQDLNKDRDPKATMRNFASAIKRYDDRTNRLGSRIYDLRMDQVRSVITIEKVLSTYIEMFESWSEIVEKHPDSEEELRGKVSEFVTELRPQIIHFRTEHFEANGKCRELVHLFNTQTTDDSPGSGTH